MNRRNFLKLVAASVALPAVPLPAVAGAPVRAVYGRREIRVEFDGVIPAGTMMCYTDESRTKVCPASWEDAKLRAAGVMGPSNRVHYLEEYEAKWYKEQVKRDEQFGGGSYFYRGIPLREPERGKP